MRTMMTWDNVRTTIWWYSNDSIWPISDIMTIWDHELFIKDSGCTYRRFYCYQSAHYFICGGILSIWMGRLSLPSLPNVTFYILLCVLPLIIFFFDNTTASIILLNCESSLFQVHRWRQLDLEISRYGIWMSHDRHEHLRVLELYIRPLTFHGLLGHLHPRLRYPVCVSRISGPSLHEEICWCYQKGSAFPHHPLWQSCILLLRWCVDGSQGWTPRPLRGSIFDPRWCCYLQQLPQCLPRIQWAAQCQVHRGFHHR